MSLVDLFDWDAFIHRLLERLNRLYREGKRYTVRIELGRVDKQTGKSLPPFAEVIEHGL